MKRHGGKLTLPMRFLLATPEGREHAVRGYEVAAVAGARLHQPSMAQLIRKGLLNRELVPAGHTRHYVYWRTARGAALAATAEDHACDLDGAAIEESPATTRADVTYRATLRSFGLPETSCNRPRPPELCALPRPQRDAFEAAWTEAMYDAAAAAGEPVERFREPVGQPTRIAAAMAGKLGQHYRANPVN